MKQIDYTEVTIKLMDEYTSKYLQENAELVQDTIKATLEAIDYSRCCETLKIKDLMTFEDYKNNLFVKSDGVYQPKKTNEFRWYSEKQLKKMYNNNIQNQPIG